MHEFLPTDRSGQQGAEQLAAGHPATSAEILEAQMPEQMQPAAESAAEAGEAGSLNVQDGTLVQPAEVAAAPQPVSSSSTGGRQGQPGLQQLLRLMDADQTPGPAGRDALASSILITAMLQIR